MSDQSQIKSITGRHVLIGMVAFFAVIIAVNLTLATFANLSWTGREVKNSYVASQDYNTKLATAERQRALGWHSRLLLDKGELKFTLANSTGTGITGARINAKLKRPVQENDDQPLAFREVAPGDYRAAAPADRGLWDVDLMVDVPAQETYRQIFRINVKE
ncbi:MAG: FixH family protein [Aestuariivirgaceae bacterium]